MTKTTQSEETDSPVETSETDTATATAEQPTEKKPQKSKAKREAKVKRAERAKATGYVYGSDVLQLATDVLDLAKENERLESLLDFSGFGGDGSSDE